MQNLYNRIEYIIKNNSKKPNVSLYEFAKSVGTNPTKFAEIKSGKVKTLSQNIALEISKQYGFSFKWILTGEGEMYEKQNPIKKELERTFDSYSEIEKTFKFPKTTTNDEYNHLMSTITLDHIGIKPSCGTGTSVYDNAEIVPVTLGLKLIQNVFKVSDPKKLKLFTASGDSMETTIYDCDLLLVDENRQDYNNGGIFIITINNEWYCKRLRLMLNGDLEIISDNPKYGTEIKHPDDEIEIKVIGKVIRNLSRGL